MGRSERVKLAEERSASAERGGRPCLEGKLLAKIAPCTKREEDSYYFTKSARLKACNDLLASLAISLSATLTELGGWDHLCADGVG